MRTATRLAWGVIVLLSAIALWAQPAAANTTERTVFQVDETAVDLLSDLGAPAYRCTVEARVTPYQEPWGVEVNASAAGRIFSAWDVGGVVVYGEGASCAP